MTGSSLCLRCGFVRNLDKGQLSLPQVIGKLADSHCWQLLVYLTSTGQMSLSSLFWRTTKGHCSRPGMINSCHEVHMGCPSPHQTIFFQFIDVDTIFPQGRTIKKRTKVAVIVVQHITLALYLLVGSAINDMPEQLTVAESIKHVKCSKCTCLTFTFYFWSHCLKHSKT